MTTNKPLVIMDYRPAATGYLEGRPDQTCPEIDIIVNQEGEEPKTYELAIYTVEWAANKDTDEIENPFNDHYGLKLDGLKAITAREPTLITPDGNGTSVQLFHPEKTNRTERIIMESVDAFLETYLGINDYTKMVPLKRPKPESRPNITSTVYTGGLDIE